MSQNQSRAERSDSAQFRKTGRSSSYQQRSLTGGGGGKGGGAGTSAPSFSSNQSRSFKKNNNNAQGGQYRATGPSVNLDANNQNTADLVHNGAHIQQASTGVSDTPVTSAPVKTSDVLAPKTSQPIPKSPTSGVTNPNSETTSETTAPATAAKGDASRSFPLQFGSISPGVMHIARTSSAPPNIDEQKRDQARHQTSKAPITLPPPSIPNNLPKNDGGTTDRFKGEIHAKLNRDGQVAAVPPPMQNQKPSVHPIPARPMQMPFLQPQVQLHFGGPNPQIQSQAMSATVLPMSMPMPSSIGNPLQQHVFVSGLQPHTMQSQGLIHQGQGLNFSSLMGPQMHQLGNMGINMNPQFPQQQVGKLGGPRKVKITHPDTHEELKFDGSSGPRSHRNMPPQSQPVPSFQHTHPMNYYPNSYNSSSLFTPAPVFRPVSSSQINPSSQPPRSHNQVTVRSAGGSHGEKGASSASLPAVASEYLKPHAVDSVHLQKDFKTPSQSSLQQSKPGQGPPSISVTMGSRQPALRASTFADNQVPCSLSSPSTVPIDGTVSVKRHQQSGEPDAVEDEKKIPLNSNHSVTQDQVGGGSASSSSLCSRPLEIKSLDAKITDTTLTGEVPESAQQPPSTTAVGSSDAHVSKTDHALENKACKPSKSFGVEVEETRQLETEIVTDVQNDVMLPEISVARSKSVVSPEVVSVESSIGGDQIEDRSLPKGTVINNVGSSSEILEGLTKESVRGHMEDENGNANSTSSAIDLSPQDEKTSTSDAALSTRDEIDVKETSFARSIPSNQDFTSVLVPSPHGDQVQNEEEVSQSKSSNLISQSTSESEKSELDTNVTNNTAPRGKKKRKDLLKKANAAGTISDLYMAYKGPEEKKETLASFESPVNTSSNNLEQISPDVIPEDVPPSEKDGQGKQEPDDWEDAADISTSKLEHLENENQVNRGVTNYDDGDGLMTKKYSKDFLLKFAERCSGIPEGFEITPDLSDALMVSNANVSRESYPNSVRGTDRPTSGPRPDRRGNGIGDEEKWSKFPGPFVQGRDMRMDIGPGGQVMGFRPGQGGNYGVLGNPHAQVSAQYPGGILAGPMQHLGPQVIRRNNSESERWARGTGFQKGLMLSPQNPSQMMHKAERKYQIGKVSDEEEAKQRLLKGILNKLTPQNFEKLFEQVKQVNIDNVVTLTGVISQIFDKALMEPTFCEMYADFCYHLASELPDLSVDNEKITFKRLLLNKCQEEFERGEREQEEANKADEEGEVKQSEQEREEKRLRVRRRMLGNIRLIGELYKKKMLTERIMHECIKKLLGGPGQVPDEEDIEALCKLMSTIGEMIDHPKAKVHMDAYFDMMANLSINMDLSSRVRFMLLDAIDLRKNKWQQRRKVEGPKKIDEVHRDAAQERQAQASRTARSPIINSSIRRGQQMDFAPRGSNMFSSPIPQFSGLRAVPPQRRGFGAQDVRFEDRHPLDSRTLSVPLPQRSLIDDSITLGPQGGLGRGMSYRGPPSASSGPLADVSSPGEPIRMASALNGFGSTADRSAYGSREDIMPRYVPEWVASPSVSDQASLQEPSMNYYANKDTRNTDRSFDRTLSTLPPVRGMEPTPSQTSDRVWSEEHLRDMSMGAIKEFYSAKDEKEVVLCVKELNSPSFYPCMISLWVTDSFERKDMERDLLAKLLINLSKSQDITINQDQLKKGFESVLMTLEDAVNDAPRAAEYLGCMIAKVVSENMISLAEIGQLILDGGEEQGRLVEIGLAADVLGSILETIKSEKGDSVLTGIRAGSNLQIEKFRPSGSNKPLRLDKFI